uniref:Gram domain-containing protein 1a-like n=1 Tax=Tetraselmis sp. GSL018 TaxID=582737 RepID=A0A061R0Z2_9CHLO
MTGHSEENPPLSSNLFSDSGLRRGRNGTSSTSERRVGSRSLESTSWKSTSFGAETFSQVHEGKQHFPSMPSTPEINGKYNSKTSAALSTAKLAPMTRVRSENILEEAGSYVQTKPSSAQVLTFLGWNFQRNEEVLRLFGLPDFESVVDDWSCALQSQAKILLQGRLYLLSNFLCFYSNVFGFVKKLVIPLKDVDAIRKKKNVKVIPNSIEVVYRGEEYFFTSFLTRDDAFALMTERWRQHNSSSLRQRSASGDDAGPVGYQGTSEDDPGTKGGSSVTDPEGASEGPLCGAETPRMAPPTGGVDRPNDGGSGGGIPEGPRTPAAESEVWQPHPRPAPLRQEPCKVVVRERLGCSAFEFFMRFLSDDSTFWKEAMLERGDSRVVFGAWRPDPSGGRIRTVTFTSPVKAVMGPSETRCHQSQKYFVFEGNHLVLYTSQEMQDIPFGDYFTVETRWDVTEAEHGECHLAVAVDVPFSRKTMFRGKIEKSAIGEASSSYAAWVEKAKRALAGESSSPGSSVHGHGAREWSPGDSAGALCGPGASLGGCRGEGHAEGECDPLGPQVGRPGHQQAPLREPRRRRRLAWVFDSIRGCSTGRGFSFPCLCLRFAQGFTAVACLLAVSFYGLGNMLPLQSGSDSILLQAELLKMQKQLLEMQEQMIKMNQESTRAAESIAEAASRLVDACSGRDKAGGVAYLPRP